MKVKELATAKFESGNQPVCMPRFASSLKADKFNLGSLLKDKYVEAAKAHSKA